MFLRNRKLTMTVDKRTKHDPPPTPSNPHEFEQRVDHIHRKLERAGKMLVVGVFGYVLLDTFRQVQVAKTIYNQPTEKD